MRITGYFHLFPPEHNAGSETTVHAALRAMVNRGHEVTVICDRSKTAPYEIDGIKVNRPPRRGVQSWLEEIVKDAQLLVTHLDLTSQAMTLALTAQKPLVHFVHNSAQLKYWHVNTVKCQLAVFNSHWIAQAEDWPGPQIIIHPVVEPERYRCERGDSVTLVNPTSGKGAKTFYDLAEMMPDRSFLTAQGGYGIQVPCPNDSDINRQYHTFYDDQGSEQECFGLPNVTHVKNDPDVRNILRRTKVLLMPSDYESYGRIGIEAACAGIPTIAHPTEGLKEAFGDAAVFCDRNETKDWFVEIDRLYRDEVYYRKRSDRALELAATLNPESEFDRLEAALLVTSRDYFNREEVRMIKKWVCDRRIWETTEGKLVPEQNGRIPANAVRLAAGIGSEIPEEVAIAHGLIPDPNMEAKAIAGPAENKALDAPEQTKKRGRKKNEDVAA